MGKSRDIFSMSPEELRIHLETKLQLKRPIVTEDEDEENEGLLTGLDEMDSGDWEWWHDPDEDYNE